MATTVTTTKVPGTAHGQSGNHAHDHVHGDMDTKAHQRTFDGFVRFLAWNAIIVTAVLIFMALANS